jgi:hypothetical protein
MQKRINGKMCDTETATQLGNKAVGEYGDPTGYEEILYINRMKQHFLYGNGGLESIYTKPTIKLFTDEQAEAWKQENNITPTKTEAPPVKAVSKQKPNAAKKPKVSKGTPANGKKSKKNESESP